MLWLKNRSSQFLLTTILFFSLLSPTVNATPPHDPEKNIRAEHDPNCLSALGDAIALELQKFFSETLVDKVSTPVLPVELLKRIEGIFFSGVTEDSFIVDISGNSKLKTLIDRHFSILNRKEKGTFSPKNAKAFIDNFKNLMDLVGLPYEFIDGAEPELILLPGTNWGLGHLAKVLQDVDTEFKLRINPKEEPGYFKSPVIGISEHELIQKIDNDHYALGPLGFTENLNAVITALIAKILDQNRLTYFATGFEIPPKNKDEIFEKIGLDAWVDKAILFTSVLNDIQHVLTTPELAVKIQLLRESLEHIPNPIRHSVELSAQMESHLLKGFQFLDQNLQHAQAGINFHVDYGNTFDELEKPDVDDVFGNITRAAHWSPDSEIQDSNSTPSLINAFFGSESSDTESFVPNIEITYEDFELIGKPGRSLGLRIEYDREKVLVYEIFDPEVLVYLNGAFTGELEDEEVLEILRKLWNQKLKSELTLALETTKKWQQANTQIQALIEKIQHHLKGDNLSHPDLQKELFLEIMGIQKLISLTEILKP
jgi:hypothetical protein